MPLANHTVPMGSGAGVCPPGVFCPASRYDPGASARADTPVPRHTAEIRSRSGSKHAQHSRPRFRTMPRGARWLPGSTGSTFRASRTVENSGKSGSTHGAYDVVAPIVRAFAAFGVFVRGAFGSAADRETPSAATSTVTTVRCFRISRAPEWEGAFIEER